MEGPSSSTLADLLKWQLHKYNTLVDQELDKVEGRDQNLVAQYEKRVENLTAQIAVMPSGEVQMRSALCCQESLASGCTSSSACILM